MMKSSLFFLLPKMHFYITLTLNAKKKRKSETIKMTHTFWDARNPCLSINYCFCVKYFSKETIRKKRTSQISFDIPYLCTVTLSVSSYWIEFWRCSLLNVKVELRRFDMGIKVLDWANSFLVRLVRRPYCITWKALILVDFLHWNE